MASFGGGTYNLERLFVCRMSPAHENLLLHLTGEPIELVVGSGSNSKTFHIHKPLLCTLSPYFRAACGPNWFQSGCKRVSLTTDDPGLVELIVQWMYTGNFKYYTMEATDFISALSGRQFRQESVDTLIRLYILADKLQIPVLQDRVITELLETNLHRDIGLIHIPRIYEELMDGSLLRQLAIDSFVWFEKPSSHGKLGPEAIQGCAEFLYDVAASYNERAWKTWKRDQAIDGKQLHLEFDQEEDLSYHRRPTDPSSKSCIYHTHDFLGFCPSADLLKNFKRPNEGENPVDRWFRQLASV